MTVGSVAWFGDRAVVVTLTEPGTRAVVAAGLAESLPGCDVRTGMESVLVVAPEPDAGLLAAVEEAAAGLDAARAVSRGPLSQVEIPVDYSGADLDEVARMLGCAVDAVVAAHQAQSWSVAMMGFAPGFGYLVPLGEPALDWARLDRRDSPRQQVPRGSVAVAAGMSAVYPASMPGGWHLLGHTTAVLFDAADEVRPTMLQPGDRVHFAQVTA